MAGSVKIFLDKDGERVEVDAEKVVGKGGPRFWLKEKDAEPPQQQGDETEEDESVTEEAGP